MKLNWLRAGNASIAECGDYTAFVRPCRGKWGVYAVSDRDYLDICAPVDTREAAEAACESWLDQRDKPVWHDATEWLSWAEWRGKRIYLRTEVHMTPGWGAYLHGERHIVTRPSRDEAKAAAEKYVREQTQ